MGTTCVCQTGRVHDAKREGNSPFRPKWMASVARQLDRQTAAWSGSILRPVAKQGSPKTRSQAKVLSSGRETAPSGKFGNTSSLAGGHETSKRRFWTVPCLLACSKTSPVTLKQLPVAHGIKPICQRQLFWSSFPEKGHRVQQRPFFLTQSVFSTSRFGRSFRVFAGFSDPKHCDILFASGLGSRKSSDRRLSHTHTAGAAMPDRHPLPKLPILPRGNVKT